MLTFWSGLFDQQNQASNWVILFCCFELYALSWMFSVVKLPLIPLAVHQSAVPSAVIPNVKDEWVTCETGFKVTRSSTASFSIGATSLHHSLNSDILSASLLFPCPVNVNDNLSLGLQYVPYFGLGSRWLKSAICLPLLKPAVFTYSLFPNSKSFFGIYCWTPACIFYDHNSKLTPLPILF